MCELYSSRGYMRVDIRRSMDSWLSRPWRVRGGMNLCASVVEMASRMLISGVHEWAASTWYQGICRSRRGRVGRADVVESLGVGGYRVRGSRESCIGG